MIIWLHILWLIVLPCFVQISEVLMGSLTNVESWMYFQQSFKFH